MKALLDTHTFIWWDSDPARLSPAAQAAVEEMTLISADKVFAQYPVRVLW